MSFTVRRLGPADLPLLSHVAADVFDDPIAPASAEAFLADANAYLVVAIEADQNDLIIGFVSAMKHLHPDKTIPELWINEVGVAPAYQRKGVGKHLMQAMFAEAKRAGCKIAWLAVDHDNEAALAFYKAVGGKEPERQLHIDFDL